MKCVRSLFSIQKMLPRLKVESVESTHDIREYSALFYVSFLKISGTKALS